MGGLTASITGALPREPTVETEELNEQASKSLETGRGEASGACDVGPLFYFVVRCADLGELSNTTNQVGREYKSNQARHARPGNPLIHVI